MFSLFVALSLSWDGKARPGIVINDEPMPVSNKNELCWEPYIVKSGDTLIGIVGQDSEKVRQLYILNRYVNLQLLSPGQEIRVPKSCAHEDEPVVLYYMNSPDFSKQLDMSRGGSLIFCLAYMFNYRTYNSIIKLKQNLISLGLIRCKNNLWEYYGKDNIRLFISENIEVEGIKSYYKLMKYKYHDGTYFYVQLLDNNNKVVETYYPYGPDFRLSYLHEDYDDLDIETFMTVNPANKPIWGN